MKNQQHQVESEFRAEEIDKRFEMDGASFLNAAVSHANPDGSYTYVANDGHTYSNFDDLKSIEESEHGHSW